MQLHRFRTWVYLHDGHLTNLAVDADLVEEDVWFVCFNKRHQSVRGSFDLLQLSLADARGVDDDDWIRHDATLRQPRSMERRVRTSRLAWRTTGTALSDARVPEAAAAAIMGHSLEVFHGSYVKAHRDALERDRAREALVELGLGVAAS